MTPQEACHGRPAVEELVRISKAMVEISCLADTLRDYCDDRELAGVAVGCTWMSERLIQLSEALDRLGTGAGLHGLRA